jgi:hypothetical protein
MSPINQQSKINNFVKSHQMAPQRRNAHAVVLSPEGMLSVFQLISFIFTYFPLPVFLHHPNNTYECRICPWRNGKASMMKASHAKEHILSAVHQRSSKPASKGPSGLSRMVGPTLIPSDVLDDDIQQPLPTRPVRPVLLFSISSFTSVNSLWQGLW